MSKRSYSQAFPTLAAAYGLSAIGRAFKRFNSGSSYGSYSLNGRQTMAKYGKRFRRRAGSRTINKRRRFRRKRTVRKRIARIWKFMRRKGLRNIETKYLAIGWDATSTVASGSRVTLLTNAAGIAAKLYPLSTLPLGTGRSHRIGNKIFVKDCKMRFYLQAPPRPPEGSAVKVPNEIYVRIVLCRIKEEVSNMPANTDYTIRHVYQAVHTSNASDPTSPIAGDSRKAFISLYYKYYNSKFADNFTVLWDKTFKVSNENGAGQETKVIKKIIRVNQPCHWDDGNNRGDGHLVFFYFCDVTSVVETDAYIPLLWMLGRITYTDI